MAEIKNRRTYLDACLLIAAFKGEGAIGRRALAILDDPELSGGFVISDAVKLEILPKAKFHRQFDEVKFYETIFSSAECIPWDKGALEKAETLSEKFGLASMDAIHVAHAIQGDVDDFVTAEKSTKPMFRVKSINMLSIRDD